MVVITVSDRAARGEREDISGAILADAFTSAGAHVAVQVVADGVQSVADALRRAIASGARAVITTGGTGLSSRDLTPEATRSVVEREVPGIAERLRGQDAQAVPASALSRGIAGTSGNCIIVNVAGSPGAARSAASVLVDVLGHAVSQMDGADH